MRKLNLLWLMFFHFNINAQNWWEVYPYTTVFDFEDSTNLEYLSINQGTGTNIWQIGAPEKIEYVQDVNLPGVIITDRLLPYPINDTSSFTIKIPLPSEATDYLIYGQYYVDSDSLNDYGKIEYSHDNGETWVLISDDTTVFSHWSSDSLTFPGYWGEDSKPVLTGKSDGWQSFTIDLIHSYSIFGNPNHFTDVACYRFTFISDSIFDNRDGLMFDNLMIMNIFAFDIDEKDTEEHFVYPNPIGSEELHFKLADISQAEIYALDGRAILKERGNGIQKVNIDKLVAGTYILQLKSNSKVLYTGKFIKE